VAALVLNKVDLLAHTDFDREAFLADFRKLNATAPLFEVSCRTGQGLGDWTHWLQHVIAGHLHFEPHSHDGLDGIIEPHPHPHPTHHAGVVPA
jgi:G3E family GTPase